MQLAYSITAHRNPQQLKRMLSALYNSKDLFIVHVDARAPEVRRAALKFASSAGPNVHVMDSRRVVWAGWSQTRTQLAMMSHALEWSAGTNGIDGETRGPWDYFLNLSGQDYPIRTSEQIRAWLSERGPGKNYFDVLDFSVAPIEIRPRMNFYHFELGGKLRRVRKHRPAPKDLNVHWGSTWFIASRELCALAVNSPLATRCRKAIRFARSSDEIFFQTLLMNSPLRDTLVRDHRRKIVWEGGSHPLTFSVSDTADLLAADAFFARKFDEAADSAILDIIDQELLSGKPVEPSTSAAIPLLAQRPTIEVSITSASLHPLHSNELGLEPA